MRLNVLTTAFDAELQALLDLAAAKTLKEFWSGACRVLHSAISASSIWFAPARQWGLPSAAFRSQTGLKTEAQFQRFQERHPLRAFLLANPARHVATFSDVMSEAQLLKSKFYREFMAPQGERFCAVFAFRRGTSLRGFLGLNRLQDKRDFSRAELRTLNSLHGQLCAVLNTVWELQRERSARRMLELVLAPLPLPIVVLDWDLDVLYHNHAAMECAVVWNCHGNGSRFKLGRHFELPAVVRDGCLELKKAWSQRSAHVRGSSERNQVAVAHPTLTRMQAVARLLHLEPPGLPLFAIVFENVVGVVDVPVADSVKFSQLARLSAREREVASLVCKGESNKEVAAHLGKSVLTVKAQLHSIYEKLGTDSRARLMSLLQER